MAMFPKLMGSVVGWEAAAENGAVHFPSVPLLEL